MKIKIFINGKFDYMIEYIKSIHQIFEKEGTTIYDSRNLIKVFKEPKGLLINVKRYHVPSSINRYVYSFGIRKPKGLRAYRYPAKLLNNGIETPEPIAYIEERQHGILGYSYFVSVQCSYTHTMYEVADAKEGSYERLASALAKYVAHMHDKGMMHLDFSPGNILWEEINDDYYFSVVDINRMYFGKVNMKKGCNNLKRLWGPKKFFIMLVQEYAKYRGFDVDEAVNIALKKRAKFWKHYSRKHPIKFNYED